MADSTATQLLPDPDPDADTRAAAAHASPFASFRRAMTTLPLILAAMALLLIVAIAILAPVLWTMSPIDIAPAERLAPPSPKHWLGTDAFGRDLYSRIVYGARISLLVGLGVTAVSVTIGLMIGVTAGYFRALDSVIMRTMDGIMAIPGILLAIALVTVSGAGLLTVIIAISIPEIPRVVRLVRSVILRVRTEPYVEAAVTLGTPPLRLVVRHMVPNTIPPLIVQGTFVFASAMLTEAVMSFLGVGLPPEIPTWGNIMAEGRAYFQIIPGLVLYAGAVLSLTVLAINVLGDGFRDALDPQLAKVL